jgi:hypothetical protein
MAKQAQQFAIGISKDVLLVQHHSYEDTSDVSKMFLIERSRFQSSLQRVVLVSSEQSAKLIAALFTCDRNDSDKDQYHTHIASRHRIDHSLPIRVFAV